MRPSERVQGFEPEESSFAAILLDNPQAAKRLRRYPFEPQANLMMARYYSSSLGRFLAVDLIDGDPTNPQSMNLYSYVRNNPISLSDPTGLIAGGGLYGGGVAGSMSAVEAAGLSGPRGMLTHNNPHSVSFLDPDTPGQPVGGGEAALASSGAVASMPPAHVRSTAHPDGAESDTPGEKVNFVIASMQLSFEWHFHGRCYACEFREMQNVQLGIIFPPTSRAAGAAGEAAVGIAKNTQRIASLLGVVAYRIPDILDRTLQVMGEIKNVGYLSYTMQLRDYVLWAQMNGFQFVLYTRADTVLSGPLAAQVEGGAVTLQQIP